MIRRIVVVFLTILFVPLICIESPILSYAPMQQTQQKTLQLVYLKYATTHEILPTLGAVCSDCQWVVLHEKQAIGLLTTSSRWAGFRDAIKLLDKRRDLIRLEIDVIEVSNIMSERYQHIFSQLTQPIISNKTIESTLQLMVSSGNANIVSSPRLIGRSGQIVELKVGDQVPYKTTIQNASSVQSTIQYIHSGIELKIIPYAHYAKRIDLNIELSYKVVTGYRIENGVEMPIIASRRSKLNLQVIANSTVIFAGLLDQSTHESIEKVPLLGDIPLIGELFKKKIMKKRTSDLIYKIRASIIN